MPNYDYCCTACDHEFEVSHGMNDAPRTMCPECGSPAKKLISACGLIVKNTGAIRAAQERHKSEREMREDLRQNYGVEKISPIGGNTVTDVYRDVKQQGTFVRDKMQLKREQNAAQTKAKQREWARKANRRVAKKTIMAQEKRAEEAAAKRAIRL